METMTLTQLEAQFAHRGILYFTLHCRGGHWIATALDVSCAAPTVLDAVKGLLELLK